MADESSEKVMVEQQDNLEMNNNYGFKINLRMSSRDMYISLPWLQEKVIKTSYQIRVSGMILLIVYIILLFGSFMMLMNHSAKWWSYMAVPYIIILLGIFFLFLTMIFIDPSSGSIFKTGLMFMKELYIEHKVKKGKKARLRKTKIANIKDDGLIKFSNNEYARAFIVDGKASATAYPIEILKQEQLTRNYQRSRRDTCTEIKISSSEPQNARAQLKNLEKLLILNDENPAIQALIRIQSGFIASEIDGIKTTVVQYLLIKGDTVKMVDDYCDNLLQNVRQGYYYSIKKMNKELVEKHIGDIFALK